jgi:hypothetical protein
MDIGSKLFLSTTLAGLDSRDGVCKADLTLSTQGRRGTYSCSINKKLRLAEQRKIKLNLLLNLLPVPFRTDHLWSLEGGIFFRNRIIAS